MFYYLNNIVREMQPLSLLCKGMKQVEFYANYKSYCISFLCSDMINLDIYLVAILQFIYLDNKLLVSTIDELV